MFDSFNRAIFTFRIICVGLITGISLSVPLWLSNRLLPLVPVYGQINILPTPIDKVLLGILLLCLFFGLLGRYIQLTAIIIFTILFLFLMSDQLRWQPWVYQYGLMLVPFMFLDSKKNTNAIIKIQMQLIICIYLWTGIHKLQPQFILYVSNPIFKNLFHLSPVLINKIKYFGYLIPFTEIVTGLLLINFKTRKVGFFLLLVSHVFILYYLSPMGINFNSVVWPWNAVMILFGLVLFYNNTPFVLDLGFVKKHIAIFIFFCLVLMILPILNLNKKWDNYLSFNVYSGKPNELVLIIPKNITKLPFKLSEYVVDGSLLNESSVLNLNRWSMFELNVPIPPQYRIYSKLTKQISMQYNIEGDLLIRELKDGNTIIIRKPFNQSGKTLPE